MPFAREEKRRRAVRGCMIACPNCAFLKKCLKKRPEGVWLPRGGLTPHSLENRQRQLASVEISTQHSFLIKSTNKSIQLLNK